MIKLFAITSSLAASLLSVPSPVPDSVNANSAAVWNVDPNHTQLNFSVRHFFTPVSGTFKTFEITLDYDAENPSNSHVNVSIDVASVNTENDRRNNHLRSSDFFDVESHSKMTFRSTAVRRIDAQHLRATGDLTIKGVTKSVDLDIELLGIQQIPAEMREMLGGVTRVASFKATTKVDRRDFGVGVGSWAETAIVGSEVGIEILVEANQT